jgi:hypothetical protein
LNSAHEKRTRVARFAREGIIVEDLARKIALKYRMDCTEILRRGRDCARSQARKELAFAATQEYHFSVAAVACYLGVSSPSVSAMISDFVKKEKKGGEGLN